jgi:predicted transcriptional regulator
VNTAQLGFTAKRLLEIVRLIPGVHLREVQRRAGFGLGNTVYQLERLESQGLIESERHGRYRRYYSTEIKAGDRLWLSLVINPNRRRIVSALLAERALNLSELASRLGVRKSTAIWHLRILETAGLLVLTKDPEGSDLWLLRDLERAKRLFIGFKPTTLDKLSESYLQSWDLLAPD